MILYLKFNLFYMVLLKLAMFALIFCVLACIFCVNISFKAS